MYLCLSQFHQNLKATLITTEIGIIFICMYESSNKSSLKKLKRYINKRNKEKLIKLFMEFQCEGDIN